MLQSGNRMRVVALCVAALCAAPALAEKPEGKGNSGKHDRSDRSEQRDDDRGKSQAYDKKQDRSSGGDRHHFDDRQRSVVVKYYGDQHRAGHCPPGLARKQNGCMPPGQAKKWHVGRPLPPEVIFYELPRQVLVDLGPPPPRHRYVRVGGDILLLAMGTGMVIDALSGLAGM